MQPFKNNCVRCKLREYTFSQLVPRWKGYRNDNLNTRIFISDLIELGLPGLRIVSFTGTSSIYCQFYDEMDTIFDNLESFCLSLKKDVCWPIRFQKWVLIKFLVHVRKLTHDDNAPTFSIKKNKDVYDCETNRNKLICQEFEKYYSKDKYPRFYAKVLLSTLLPASGVDPELLTDKRDLQTLQTCLKYSKFALQDLRCQRNIDINDNVSILNKELDKVYFVHCNRIHTYVNCVDAYAQGLKKFKKFDKIATLWLEWIKDILAYQYDFDIGININMNLNGVRNGNYNFNCNENNFISSVKLIFQQWTLTKTMIDSVLQMIEFILWYDLKIEHCPNLQHVLDKMCVSFIKYDKYFNKLKRQLISMSSVQVLDSFIDDIEAAAADDGVINPFMCYHVKDKYCCEIRMRQEECKMILRLCFKLMMHNFLLHDTGCHYEHLNYSYSNSYSYSYRHKYNYLNNNLINLEYLNKAKFCLENQLAKILNIIEHDELLAYSIYWILGDEQKCSQIKQMIFVEMKIIGNRMDAEIEAINRLENEYLAIVRKCNRNKNLKVTKIDIQQQIMIKYDIVKRWMQISKKNQLSNIILTDDDTIKLLNNLSMGKQCNWYKCKIKSAKLFKCKQCQNVRYCSRICQKKDWIWTHRLTCTR